MTEHPYVIVRPGGWGHVSDDPHAHLVVRVDEWLRVHHKEQAAYGFVIEHRTFDAAHNERNSLNGIPGQLPVAPEPEPVPVEQVENPVEITGQGVQWLGAKAS